MEFLDLAKSRCTTRGFNDTPISEEDLQKVLSAVLVFTGVYLVTQSKSRADLEKESH